MSKSNDEKMLELIKAKKEGLKIVYGEIGFQHIVEKNHAWDLHNNYTIIRPREYIICIPSDGREAFIKDTVNIWTCSDFGKLSGRGAEYILMREVFEDEM